jgi:hypothetical protein
MVTKRTAFFRRVLRKIKNIIGFRSAVDISPLRGCINQSFLYVKEELIIVGTSYGGWLLPKHHNLTQTSICYLAGAGEDISFDCALVERFGV